MKLFHMGNIAGMATNDILTTENLIKACELAVIGTTDKETGARLSVLNNLPGQNIKELYFATDVNSHKVKNIWENPSGEVLFSQEHSQVCLSGTFEVQTDMESKEAKWEDYMIDFFTDGLEGETFCVLKFKTSAVRIMIM